MLLLSLNLMLLMRLSLMEFQLNDSSRFSPDLQCFAYLENVIRSKFIPALTSSCAPSDLYRNLLALPIRLGQSNSPTNCCFSTNIEFDLVSCSMCIFDLLDSKLDIAHPEQCLVYYLRDQRYRSNRLII